MGTFKDELRRYRPPPSSAIKRHLKRWIESDDAEAIWQKVSKAAGANLTAEEFIQFVVRSRAAAAGLSARIKGNARDRGAVIEQHQTKIKRALSSKRPLSEIASVLEDAAFEMRHVEKLSDLDLAEFPSAAQSRKDQGGSQALRAFCLMLAGFLEERCGRPFDAEVAALADIALDRPEATSVDQVAGFRRQASN